MPLLGQLNPAANLLRRDAGGGHAGEGALQATQLGEQLLR